MKQAAPRPTREKLLDAARQLFNSDGFLATDTNKIARAAGFAPPPIHDYFPKLLGFAHGADFGRSR